MSVIKNKIPVRFEDESREFYYLNSVYPVMDSNNEVNGIAMLAYDLTERKKIEKDLRDSRQLLYDILNSIPIRVFWKNKDSMYLGCNKVFARDVGFESESDIIGKYDRDLVWKEFVDDLVESDRYVLRNNAKIADKEFNIIAADRKSTGSK